VSAGLPPSKLAVDPRRAAFLAPGAQCILAAENRNP
jgi:hypothetical protein